MKIYRILVLSFWMHCFVSGLYAQKTLINTLPDQDYNTAVELFEKQKYVAAQQYFQKVIDKPSSVHTGIRANAEYYSALCALELTNPDAEYLLVKFLSSNTENYKINEANFYMARHQYNEKKYSKAVEWFDKVEASKLSENQQAEYHFEAGYCCFMIQKYDKARLHFTAIKDVDTKYTAPALYYYSHIAYEQKNYETALEGFLRLRDDETFSSIVPYYITQIYFLQKKYDQVIAFAPALLDSVSDKRVGDMARMIGESYTKQGKYSEALPYLEKFAKKTPNMTLDDRYQLAYAYYKGGDLKNAIKYFEPVTTRNNALAQNALYHLADCYLKTQDKQKARLAFSSAANMDFNPDIKENALFNYAIVTYESSISSFNEPVKAFNQYLKLYPYSNHADEARNYLVLAYMSTKNYQAALDALDKMKKKDNSIRRAYQRIAFFRGLELYNNLKFDNAIDMFDKSLGFAEFDKVMASRAYYWKGESLYRLGKYQRAIELYQKFISAPGAASLDEFELAHYNVAYAYFNLKKYAEALTWFRKYTGLMKNEKSKYVADAYNRMGDCFFMKSTYWVAIENYEKVINYDLVDVDYAMFQKAFALGVVNRTDKKVAMLNQLITSYPKSSYVDDALYELGRAYVVLNSSSQAIESYNKLIKDYPSSSYAPKAMLNLGLIYYNTDKNNEAIACYKKVVEQHPGTPDSRNALNGLKTVYMEMNDVDSYFAYLEAKGEKKNVRSSEQDSLSYTTAENIYMSGDCDKAQLQFQKYIDKYKDGSFLVNANFYMADCQLKNNKADQALKGFEYVISKPHSMFSEQALSAAATIHYNKAEYAPARDLYKRLETEAEIKNNILDAKIGQMRCNYRLKDPKNAIVSAKSLLSEKIQDEVEREARYILAKSYLETQNIPAATEELKFVSKDVKSVEGAETKYLLSQLYYNQGKKELAEKEIFDFIEKNTPYQYWLGKSFILLSDIYVDRKDEFQAVHTLQSILDYYENNDDGIKAEAKTKKDKLTAKTSSASKEKQSDIEVNLENKKGK